MGEVPRCPLRVARGNPFAPASNGAAAAKAMSHQQTEAFVAGVRATIQRYRMLGPGDRVVVAVSGGPDSLALLHVLHALQAELGIALHVAHLNHRLRRAAGEDARFVAATARRLGVPCTIEAVDVRAVRRQTGLSLECAARRERYRFFARVAESVGAHRVATGHTADDNTETVLINLLRGAGTDGLAGIPPVRPLLAPFWDAHPEDALDAGVTCLLPLEGGEPAARAAVIRPLIETWRAGVEEYCQALGLEPRRDISNRSRAFLRNRVRLDLIPYLERHFGPAVRQNLQRLSLLARPDVEVLESWAAAALAEIARFGPGRAELARAGLLRLPLALQRRVTRAALRRLKGTPEEIGFREVERVLDAAAAAEPAQFDLPGPVRVSVQGDCLVFFLPEARPAPLASEALLPVPGEAPAPDGGTITAMVADRPAGFQVPRRRRAREAMLDADSVALPLVVRTWRPGDRFVPLGMTGHKTLHQLFIEQKVPVPERHRTPIVADQQGILWVAGVAIADRAKVTDATRRLLRLVWTEG